MGVDSGVYAAMTITTESRPVRLASSDRRGGCKDSGDDIALFCGSLVGPCRAIVKPSDIGAI